MELPLSLHLSIHFFLAIIAGYCSGKFFKKPALGILIGFIGGFLIDLDHVLEYFLVYGPHFSLLYFSQGRQFLVSDQIHLYFHAWEYLPLLLLSAYLLRKKETIKVILITLAFAGSIHLLTDSVVNREPLKFYTISYRASVNFSAPRLMSTESYEKNQNLKKVLGF